MPRKAAATEVEIGEVGENAAPPRLPTVATDSTNKTSEPKNPGPEFVTREEHDEAVKALRNEISDLKVVVADLESVVTSPEGSVRFAKVESPDVQKQWNDDPGVPDYTSSERESGGAVEWY